MLIDKDFAQVCAEGVCQTARRLGVDPVAFAEACQDGLRLAVVLEIMTRHPNFGRIYKDWLDALKRTEPQPTGYSPTTSTDGELS